MPWALLLACRTDPTPHDSVARPPEGVQDLLEWLVEDSPCLVARQGLELDQVVRGQTAAAWLSRLEGTHEVLAPLGPRPLRAPLAVELGVAGGTLTWEAQVGGCAPPSGQLTALIPVALQVPDWSVDLVGSFPVRLWVTEVDFGGSVEVPLPPGPAGEARRVELEVDDLGQLQVIGWEADCPAFFTTGADLSGQEDC